MNATRKPWQGTLQQILIGLVVATLMVAAIEAMSDYDKECGWSIMGTTWTHSGSGGKHKIRIGRGSCRLDVDLRGDIDLAPDDRGIERLAPGASLEIKQRIRRERRRLDVERDPSGEPEYTWYVNSVRQDFDDEARDWLAEVLPRIYRTTGLDADGRVERLWAEGGADAVLEEMAEIPNDHVRGIYLRELFDLGADEAGLLAAIEFGRREISSDHELGKSLARLEPRDLESAAVRDAWVSALTAIDSDWQLRQTLVAVLEKDGLSGGVLDAVLRAARTVGSDHEQAQLLAKVAEELPAGETLPASYSRALESIGADHEHRRVLAAALARPGLTGEEAEELLATAPQISGDYELAELLAVFAEDFPDDHALPPSFFRALETIDSDQAVRRVLISAVGRRGLGAEAWTGLLEAARSVSSEFELSAFLVDFLKFYPEADELPGEFDRLCDALDADFEREKVEEARRRRRGSRPAPAPDPIEPTSEASPPEEPTPEVAADGAPT